MKTKATKLSLEDFKSKTRLKSREANLDKISGGILGACHTQSTYYNDGSSFHATFYCK